MSDLGTVIALAVSRARGGVDLRCFEVRSLRAVTASTSFFDSTGRVPGSTVPQALAFGGRWHRNINLFSVDQFGLRVVLGPANPRVTSSAEEPLLLWPSGFSPDFRCYCDQDCRDCAVHTSFHPYFRPDSLPT